LQKYTKLLKENDLKITPQRLMILKYLDKHKNHPTADEIYSELKKDNPSLSKTTVYNSLLTLKQHKIIKSLTICDSEHRYDIRDDIHHHFLCEKCGKIIDLDLDCPYINNRTLHGHKILERHGYLKGICKDCLKKEKNE